MKDTNTEETIPLSVCKCGHWSSLEAHNCQPHQDKAEGWETLRKGYEEVQMVESSIEKAYPEAYRLARKFHELYEEQAPFFGYITNPNSREFYPNSNNARLMAYVCYTIVKDELLSQQDERRKKTKDIIIKWLKNESKSGYVDYIDLADVIMDGRFDLEELLELINQ